MILEYEKLGPTPLHIKTNQRPILCRDKLPVYCTNMHAFALRALPLRIIPFRSHTANLQAAIFDMCTLFF